MPVGDRFPAVLAASQAGAEWGLSALYRDVQPALLRYLRSQEPGAAEDLASETWIAVAEGLHRFSGAERDFRAWVFTIARRRLVDLRRSAARRRTVPLAPSELAHHGGDGDVEDEAMAALSSDAALARLRSLPAEQAEIVLLRVLGGLSTDEVARALGKRAGTVRVMQHRALRRLADDLAPQDVTE
jgi:RNA polymerase sigma-70 factor (ECF subfamily)